MPATITISQTPNQPFDMAYGPNPVTLTGITTAEDKYVLRVFAQGNATPIADVRQTPNQYGKAIFDLQNILQSHVAPPDNDIDSLGVGPGQPNSMRNSATEGFHYTLSIGYEAAGQVTIMPTGYGPYTVYGGSKQYFEVPYYAEEYQSQVTSNPSGCTQINRVGKALTDVVWYTGPAETGDNIQDYVYIGTNIATRNVYADDLTTVSWYQKLDRTGTANNKLRGIEAWRFYWVNGDTVMNAGVPTTVTNTTNYSGGPNANIGQGLGIPSTLQAITLATGPYNLPGNVSIPAGCTHYYVVPVAFTPLYCAQATDPQTQTALDYKEVMQTQRFNILQESCNDFEHFQFSWYNSKGFKDYFTFTKRVDHSTTTNRNNFLKEAADYNSQAWSVNEMDRGYTTYSSEIQDIYTVTSGFMNDDEARLLQSMFQSPDVMVRMADQDPLQWKPINILSASYEQKTNRKNKLFQYTVQFKLAHNIKAQRG